MLTLNLSGLPFATKTCSSDDEFTHNHDYYECFYIVEGEIYHEICGKRSLLSTGDAVIIKPGITHSFVRIPNKTCLHRDNMISNVMLYNCCKFLDNNLYETINNKNYIEFKISEDAIKEFEKKAINYIFSSNIEQRLKYEKLLTSYIVGMIILSDNNDIAIDSFQTKCITTIGELFTKPDAVKEIYKALHYNESYLSKKFKEVFGLTMTAYVNELKIKHAMYLLTVTDLTIPSICEMIGIDSLPYFHKLFRQATGMTPKKYRNKNNDK